MATSHLKPLKQGIAHGRNAYHESEKDTEAMPVFAYMRRSTDKEEQKDSILQQEEGIVHIAQVLGFDLKKARKFTETKSGFENRKRPQWKEMIKEIDKLKVPCALLCRDTSRLSRNPRDNLIIADRIFGDDKTRKTIGKVYFLGDNFNIQEWNDGTDKKYIVDKLHGNYTESLETKTKSINGHILKLQVGIYPYHPAPKGLEPTQFKGRKVLKQNEKMSFIRKAFEMKAERRGHQEISQYLRRYGDIKIGAKELTDRIFTNTVYIGEYTEKNTKQNFKNLLFLEGKTPIASSLWDKVQHTLSKKGRKYRGEEERDIFEEKGRIEGGLLLARDKKTKMTKKGEQTYTYYKNTKAKVNIAQDKILETFIGEIEKIIALWAMPFILSVLISQLRSVQELRKVDFSLPMYLEIKELLIEAKIKAIEKNPIEFIELNIGQEFFILFILKVTNNISFREYQELALKYTDDGVEEVFSFAERIGKIEALEKEFDEFEKNFQQKGQESGVKKAVPADNPTEELFAEGINKMKELSDIFIKKVMQKNEIFKEGEDLKKAKKQEILKLEQQKKETEEQRKEYRKKAVLAGFTGKEIEEQTKDFDKSILLIEEQIEEFGESTDMEELLERLPDILTEIVELSRNALTEKETEKKKDDLIKLFKITVSNFSISTKKELKIQLFEVLDRLVNRDKVGMEAPPGVEPGYEALQAPV